MDIPVYTCERRALSASATNPDVTQTYRMIFIDKKYEPGTDLYKKYGITNEEQAFIEAIIRPMSADDE